MGAWSNRDKGMAIATTWFLAGVSDEEITRRLEGTAEMVGDWKLLIGEGGSHLLSFLLSLVTGRHQAAARMMLAEYDARLVG